MTELLTSPILKCEDCHNSVRAQTIFVARPDSIYAGTLNCSLMEFNY